MAVAVSDAIKNMQDTITELQNTYRQIKGKTDTGQLKGCISSQIKRIEGMENRLDNVEEINSRNSCKLQSIMEMVKTLSQKVENVSVLIVESKKGLCAEQGIQTLNSESGEHSKMTRQEQMKDVIESNVECKETVVTSVKQSILKETSTEATGKMKSDLRTTSGDNKSNSLVDDLNNSKTEVQNITVNGETNNTKTTVSKETGNVKQKRSVVRNKCGYKLSLTVENVDNRIFYRKKKRCYQGELLHPVMENTDKPNLPEPNIRIQKYKERTFQKGRTDTSQKQKGIMPMAQMAEGDYDNKQKTHSFEEWAHIAGQSQHQGRSFHKTAAAYLKPTLSTDTPCPEAERLVTTANVTPKTTNSNSLLPNTASNDIQQHVNSANSGDVDIRNLTVTLIRTVVLQRSWYQMPGCSVQVVLKANLNFGKISSRGHNYVILLDTSESMKGKKFDLMIKTATEYIEGIQTMSLKHNIRDNIGLACFGRETTLLLPPFADYDDIKTEIGKLKPGGPSPLAAGLLMALSGITHCHATTKFQHDFKPCVILMTDGMATPSEALDEEGNINDSAFAATSLQSSMVKDKELHCSAAQFSGRGMNILCVPFGSANTDVLNFLVTNTHGKIIPPNQIQRLCRMTHSLFSAAEIAHQLESAEECNKLIVKKAVLDAGLQEYDTFDDVTDNAMLLLDPSSKYHGRFKQTKWPAIPLGSRVRRGPSWSWKNQDSNMAGTVIGEDTSGMIWVQWDSGHKNCYRYHEGMNAYDIKPVNEPRRLVDDLIAVGCKVKRGKDWRYGDQDGGRGSKGTVLRVDENGEIVVNWDRGRLGSYKFAADGVFEVEVCEHGRRLNSPDLIEHQKDTETTSELPDVPLILPATKGKSKKPVTSTWQYQDESGQWTSYDEDTNCKIEKAFNRNHNGRCIIEINKTVHVMHFSKMIQENQTDKTTVRVQRLDLN